MKKGVKQILAEFTSLISVELYYRLSYLHNRKKWLNLKKPTNLSEFIISEIVSGKIIQYAPLADKYRVREFITSKGLSHILPKLYGQWKDVDKINFNELPDQFALKVNAGCGFNIICFDKNKLDVANTKQKLNQWMGIKVFTRAEPHYDHIEKCIIAEELIQDSIGKFPTDYKFMCVNGEPHSILIISERSNQQCKRFAYDINWEKIDILKKNPNEEFPKPKNLDRMVEYARTLSQGFKFVRVDLYDTGEKVLFGELTFTPQGGVLRNFTLDALEDMYSYLKK